jgi:tRNA pseudouridine13 synthase
VKIKQRPEDFVVREGYRFEPEAEGPVWVYRMDKQKVSTLQAGPSSSSASGEAPSAIRTCCNPEICVSS